MYICVYIYIYLSISLSLYIYIYNKSRSCFADSGAADRATAAPSGGVGLVVPILIII